jgi:uncharacterized protein YndB with AHSA1/START domain
VKTTELTVSRSIPASPEAIYDVWLDTKSPGGPWFGCKKVILDVKVDGLFYQLGEHEGQQFHHYGRFVTLERGRKISHTWLSAATRGLESVVTLTFERSGDATEVTIHHTNLPDDDEGRGHKDGWGWILGCIADRFASKK